MSGKENPYTFGHFRAEVLKIAERRIKAKVEQRIKGIENEDQCKIRTLNPRDLFTFSDIPRDAFLRSRLLGSRNYDWYYYFGMIFHEPFLYHIGGFNQGFELAEGIYAHTLRLPDELNLVRTRIPNTDFPVGYFYLLSEGFPFDERILNLVLDRHPDLATQKLDLVLFGKGQMRKYPGFQDLILSPGFLRHTE